MSRAMCCFQKAIEKQKVTLIGLAFGESSYLMCSFLFQHEIAIVTEEGVEIIGPLSSETNWDIAHLVR